MMTKEKKPIRVALYGMEHRIHKTMVMYLQGPCKGIAIVVDEIDAEIDIIDVDAIEAKEVLQVRKSKTPDRPVILLSLQSQFLNGTIYVKKPVKTTELVTAIKKAYSIVNQNLLNNSQVFVTQPSKPFVEGAKKPQSIIESVLAKEQQVSEIKSPSSLDEKNQESKNGIESEEKKKTSKHLSADRLNEGGFSAYIGVAEGIDFSDIKQVLKASYNPRNYFLGYVQSAVNVAKAKARILKLNSGWKPLVVFPKTHEVWLDAEDKQLRAFAGITIRSDVGTGMKLSPVDQQISGFNKKMQCFFDTDAFIWKLAIWTSKGRYPDSIDIYKTVFLKHWPNFTRLLITPHALRISAFLIEGPKTLMEISEKLKIKPQYVFVFISATNAVGLIGQAEEKIVKTKTDKILPSAKVKKSKFKSLFSKILGKLRGS